MASKLGQWYRKKLEKEKRLRLPSCVFNEKGIQELERVLKTRNALLISNFYKYFGKFLCLEPFEVISKELKNERSISEQDSALLNRLVPIKKKDPNFFFHFFGNLYYIANLLDDVGKSPKLTRQIKISLFLWCYLNMVEVTNQFVSELIKEYIENEKIEKEYSRFIKSFMEGEHPTLGSTIHTLSQLGFIDDKNTTIFGKNKFIRNKVSHANMYYDKEKDKIYISNGKEYTVKEFMSDFVGLRDFLLEFIYRYNNNKEDLTMYITQLFDVISHQFMRIERSGPLKKALHSYVFEWEK